MEESKKTITPQELEDIMRKKCEEAGIRFHGKKEEEEYRARKASESNEPKVFF